MLETNIGTNRNTQFYNFTKIKKFIGVDWVQGAVARAEQNSAHAKATLPTKTES